MTFYKQGINDADLLPQNYKSTDAAIHPDPPDGPEAAVWVLFQAPVDQTDEKGNPVKG